MNGSKQSYSKFRQPKRRKSSAVFIDYLDDYL